MRSCPVCQRTFPDDNQINCQYDGAQLSRPFYAQPPPYQQQQQYGAPAPPPQYGVPAPPPGAYPMPPPPQQAYGTPPPAGGWQGGYPPPAYVAGAGQYVPCPRCRRPDPEKMKSTWWGGVVGPRILSHVMCRGCGLKYNGKTGQSNTTGIVIYSIIVFVVVLGLVLLIRAVLRNL
jgi:hypothetical protein